jgi:hypothetical protein
MKLFLVRPGRLFALEEGFHSGRRFSALEEPLREIRGPRERFLLLHARHFVDQALGEAERLGSAEAQVFEHLVDRRVQLVGRHRTADQAEFRGTRSREAIASQEGFHGLAVSHLRQAHYGDDCGRHAESDLGKTELHVVLCDRDVERRRQTVAPTDHVPLDLADDGRGRGLDLAEQLFQAHLGLRALRRTGLLFQVRAGAEGAALVRDDDGADHRVRVGQCDRIVETVYDHSAERVAVVHVGKGDGQDSVGGLVPNQLAHGFSGASG